MTATTEAPEAAKAEAAPKQRKRTSYEEAGVGSLRQPNGDAYLGDNGRFRPGYDAKLKSQLIEMVLDEKAQKVTKDGTALTADEATALLATLNWTRFLDASREARANRASRKRARTEKKAEEDEASADRLETAKANKTAAQAFVDQAVTIKVGRGNKLGKVLRVRRSVEDDILSPWIAVVAVPDNPQDADSAITEHEVPVADLKTA